MALPYSDPAFLHRRFRRSLVVIVATIGVAEATVMLLLDACYAQGLMLTAGEEAIVDATLLSAFSFPVIWLTSLRPLVREVVAEAARAEQLGRTNADLRQALDAHALVAITDLSGRIMQANEKFFETSGYPREELLGCHLSLLDSGQNDPYLFEQLRATVKSGRIWHGEICNRSKHGNLYWSHSTVVPLLDVKGHPAQYITIDRDITAQKKNEAKLLALYRAVEASSDMILITQASGSIQYVNPALSAFTGWPPDALIGKTPDVLQSKSIDKGTLKSMQDALGTGKSWSGRLLLRRLGLPRTSLSAHLGDPLDYWANVSITPIRDQYGQLTGHVHIQRDATHQVIAEADLRLEKDLSSTRLAITELLQQTAPLAERFEQALEWLGRCPAIDLHPNSGVYLKHRDGALPRWEPFAFYHGDPSRIFEHRAADHWIEPMDITSDAVLVHDVCSIPREGTEPELQHGHYLVPLAVDGEILGLLILLTEREPPRHASLLGLLEDVGAKMALACLRERCSTA